MEDVWYFEDWTRYSVLADGKGLEIRQHHMGGRVEDAGVFCEMYLLYPVRLEGECGEHVVSNLDEARRAFDSSSCEVYVVNLAWRMLEEQRFDD